MADSRVARIAVSGAGWWGQGWHLPHLHRRSDAVIAAIVEINPSPRSSNANEALETTEMLSSRYGVPVFKSVEELLASGVQVDGFLIGVPHAHHAHQAKLAIQAQLHVLVEKPMTTDVNVRCPLRKPSPTHVRVVAHQHTPCWALQEARALAREAEAHVAAGRYFAVNNTANWRMGCREAAAAVAAGKVGRIEHVACSMHSPLLWLFDDPRNVGWTAPVGSMTGNGFAWGQLSHLLAWVFHVTGLEPVSVFASMGHSASSGADLHDAAVVQCSGGASIAVSGSACVPGDAHSATPVGKQIEVSVFGSEGKLSYAGDDQRRESGALELRRRDGHPAHQVLHPVFEFENYAPEGTGPESMDALVEACCGREAYVGASAQVGLRTVLAIDAMYRSAASGKVEECSQ
jgi:predicted dehydrogenase